MGLLAFGDGMAGLVGQAVGGPRLPWNAGKGWAGLLAFVVFGTLPRPCWPAGRCACRSRRGSRHWPRTVGVVAAAALRAALAETVPTTLDDNLTVPLAGGLGAAARDRWPSRRGCWSTRASPGGCWPGWR